MNKTFHSVWNASKQAWVAAAETVSAKGKPTSGVKVAAVISALFGGLLSFSVHAQNAPPPNTLPTGAQVNAGQANISTRGANMVIQQSSNRAAINWQSFNVGSNAQVQFQQPDASSVTLNRVMSSDPSQIFGRITANGQVILSNPAGVYFAPSARVDVGGLIATTHDISDADFMAGKNRFERNASTGSVVNDGELKAALGGYIALLAPEVRNQGAVIAQMGTVAMASGEAVDLKFDSNNRLTSLRVEPSQIAALVENRHAVQAPGGLIILSAQSMDRLVGGVVKNSGAIEATGLQSEGGRIVLSATHKVSNNGSLDVSSATAQGGNVSLQGAAIELNDGTRIDATGVTGGGTVLVGGNWQGSADLLLAATDQPALAATTVSMAAGATIDASATQQGNGGKVVLWSDVHNLNSATTAQGTVLATGGAQGGNGGQVETSGHSVNIDNFQVDTRAANDALGKTGSWLIDPYNYNIGSTQAATIASALNTSDVTITTTALNTSYGSTSTNTDPGDIRVNSPITKTSAGTTTLTLKANRRIVTSGGAITSSGGPLNVVMWSNFGGAGGGVYFSAVTTAGGHFFVGGGSSSTTWKGLTVPSGPVSAIVATGGNLNALEVGGNVSTAGGSVYLWGSTGLSGGVGFIATPTTTIYTINAATADVIVRTNTFYETQPRFDITSTGAFTLWSGSGTISTDTGSLGYVTSTKTYVASTDLSYFKFNANPSSLTWGNTSNTSNVIHSGTNNSPLTVAGLINLYGNNITINAGLVASGTNTITLKSTGNVTNGVNGYVSADSLLLSGGNVTLNNSTSNAIGTLAASGVGSITYLDKDALTVGTVGGTSGISATGAVSIGTKTGDLTIAQNVSTTNASTTALVLNADINATAGTGLGGNILLANSPSISVGSGGTGKLYTGSISSSTGLTNLTDLASGSGHFRYNADETTNFSAGSWTALGTGLQAIYREQPIAAVTVANQTMTYSDAVPTLTGSMSGEVNGDAIVYSLSGRVNSASGNIRAGTYTITQNFTGLGYGFTGTPNGTLTVNAKALTMSGLSAPASKVYNGTTATTVSGTAALQAAPAAGTSTTSDGKPYPGDTVAITGTAVGTYNSKDVASATTVTFSGLSLNNPDYSLTMQTPASATIVAKALTMSGLSATASRIYNGTTSAAVSGTAALLASEAAGAGTTSDGKPYSVDTVAITGTAVGTYNSKDVGTASTVTFSGLSLNNSNYSLTIQSPASATITAKALTMSGLSVPTSKVYDGATTATVSGTATLQSSEAAGAGTTADGIPYTGDTVAITGTVVGTYNNKNVASATTVTFSGLSLNNSNYSLTIQSPASATITAKALTMTGLSAATSKVYNGTMAATVSGTAALLAAEAVGAGTTADGKPYTGDTVAITGTPVGTYNSKDVATATSVTFSGLSLNNTNYALTIQSPASATITAKALTMTGLTAPSSRIYDGTTAATVNGTAALQTAEAAGTGTTSDGKPYTGDTVAITGSPVGTYNSKDVASASTVTFSGLSLNNSNYSLTVQSPASATITAKALTMTGLSVPTSKVYNGTTTATVSGTAALQTAEAAGTGTTSDGTPYTGDTVAITGTVVGTYNSKDVASASSVNFSGLSLNNSNYSLTIQSPASATITAKALTMSGLSVPTSKIYNGTTAATVSGTAVLLSAEAIGAGTTADGKPYTGDTVAITGTAVGTYNSKDVATASSVTFSGLSLNNSNYSLTIQAAASATITTKALTMSGLSVPTSRVYDGTTAATVSGTATLQSSEAAGAGTTSDGKPYTGDTVALTGSAVGTYNSKDVASANTVTFSGLSLNNSNYSLTAQSAASATITAKALTISGLSSLDKVYDGTTTAAANGTATLQAAVAAGTGTSSDGKAYTGDSISLTGTAVGTFNSKDVVSANQVAFTGLNLTGAGTSNYTLTPHAVNSTARITPAPLTVTVNDDAKFVVETDRASFNGVSYSGFVNGETSSVLGGSITITRSNVGTNAAGSYAGVLGATGLTANNYSVTYRPGNFTITPADQLLVEVTNASTTYGTAAQYAINSVKYYNDPTNDGVNNGTVYSLGSGGVAGSSVSINSSNLVTINDGSGGTASFTLAPSSGVFSHANKLTVGSYQLGVSGAITANSANFSNTITVMGAHQVNTKGITASASSVSKSYDGTTSMTGVSLNLSTIETNDVVTVNGNGTFADKNVGTGLNYTISNLALSGGDASNYHLTGGSSFSGSNGAITAVPLTITANNASKTYDSLAYNGGNGVSYNGFVGGESARVLGGTLSYGGTSQGAINAGASYTIVPSGQTSSNYTISYADGTLTVSKANATVTANSATSTYSGVNQTVSGFTASGLVGSETAAVLTGVNASRTEKNAGTYAVTASGTDTNYNLTFVDGTMTINPAALTVTANNATKTYDSVAYSGGNGVSYSGFVGGESASVLGGTLSYGGTSQGAINSGNGYTIVPSGQTSSNYTISYADGTLTIAKANATVTANSATSTYNGANQTVSGFTASGLVGSETAAVLTGVSASRTEKNAGTYAVTASGTDTNYNLTFVDGALTIAKANATVTASSATSTYNGTNQTVSGFTASGLVGSETAAVLTGVSASRTEKNAGTYAVTASGTDTNYNLTFVDGAMTINPAALTVTANNATKTYDSVAYSGGNGVSYSGFVGGESASVLGGTLSYGGTSQGAINAGSNYTIVPSGLTSTNYTISYADGMLTVSKANATVTANSATSTYSGVNQTVSGFTVSGLVGTETAAVLTGVSASRTEKNAGTYAVTASGTDTNYNLTFVDGSMTINPAALTVTANNATKTYDSVAYSGGNGVSYNGFVGGESASVLGGTLSYGGTSQGAINAGSNYTIVPSGLSSSNYAISYADGALTINPASVSVTNITGALQGAVNKVYDGTNTALLSPANYALTGWLGSDGATVTKTSGSYDTANAGSGKTVTVSLSASDYAATGGTNLSNYTLPTSISGAMGNISKAPLTVTASNAIKTYDGVAFSGGNGVSYSGLVSGQSANVISGSLSYGGTSQGATNAGSNYTISPFGLASSNYTISYVDGTLTINPAVVVAPTVQSTAAKEYEGTNPATISSTNRILTVIQSAPSGASPSPASDSTSANNAGVTVDVRNAGLQMTTLMVAVSVPKGTATAGTGFTFEMPENVKSMAAGNTTLDITQDNGAPIPGWLKFDQGKMRFEATAVPDSGLPMQLQVTVAGQRLQVVISERTE